MSHSGLVSISFRKNTPEELISACSKASLDWIEWGSDVHCPQADIKKVKEVASLCKKEGILTRSYGSYFRLGQGGPEAFKPYLEAAQVLGSGIIRIWAGTKASRSTTPDERRVLAEEARQLCEMASTAKISIGMECHSDTLTDEYHSAASFIEEVGHPALRMYWQPSQFHVETYNLDAAKTLAPLTEVVHVFHWTMNARLPLEQGTPIWTEYLKLLRDNGAPKAYLLEFMHDDRLETLASAAKTLQGWLKR